ncbi:MAG TPA: TolC family protein, partial [bacterium]|nr:TolC family protein [bacterium]
VPAQSLSVGGFSVDLPASLDNVTTFALNMQYPVFAGFRIREAIALSRLQSESKLVGIEMVKRSLMFEVRRAYWEAVRATRNRQTLQKNLELMKAGRQLTAHQVAQGTATRADQLAADLRYNQADLDLGDAASQQARAFLVLESLIGNTPAPLALSPQPSDTPAPFTLTTQPADAVMPGVGQALEEKDLVSRALAGRPETRASSLSIQMAEHGIKQAQASLYPTVTLLGNYTVADPNQRVPFQTDPTIFTGTWALGLQLSYDIGGLPSNLAECQAQEQALRKTRADAEKQGNAVILDARTCIINLERARRDFTLTQGTVDQAVENLRVAQQRLSAGTANDLDVLTAQFNLLKTGFAVTNRQIDVQIASADLARAIALDPVR